MKGPDMVFLVSLGTNLYPDRHEVPYSLYIFLVPSWKQARTWATLNYGTLQECLFSDLLH